MKTRLPKALLGALMAAVITAGSAQAGYISPTTIWTEEGEMQLGTNPDNVSGYTIDVKDGNTTATITKDVATTSGLFVREGTLIIGGQEGEDKHVEVKINPVGGGQLDYINGTPSVLSVSGKNSVVVIDNATVTTDHKTGSSVGGPDGNGTLILQNGAKYDGSSQYYFFVGYKSYRLEGETPNYSASNTSQQILYATTNNVGDSRVDKDGKPDFSNRYVGTYTEGIGGTEFGKGVIIVTGNSEFNAPGIYEFCMGEGELKVSQNSTFNTSNHVNAALIGYGIGATSKVDIESGSEWNINGRLWTGTYTNSRAIINVDNATLNLNFEKQSFLGSYYDKADNGSYSELNLKNSATMNVTGQFYVGLDANAKLTIDNTSTFKNKDAASKGYLAICAMGVAEISGTIDVLTKIDGGTLTLKNGAEVAALTATTGILNLSGNVTFTGDVMLGSLAKATDTLTINIEQGSTIYFYDDVNLSNAIINVLLSDAEVAEGEQLFTIASVEGSAYEALKNVELNLQYGSEVTTQTGLAGVKNVSLVPEPTTATLSLLALMGLAARRRRK